MIIFDCDGVILDSEALGTEIDIACLKKYNIDISAERYNRDFCGLSYPSVIKKIHAETDILLPDHFMQETSELLEKAFETDLQAIMGVGAFLSDLRARKLPYALASSSSVKRLQHSLSCVGLYDDFADCLYSAEMVTHGKPAPDLFLYAASKHNIDPNKCTVIEDSPYGIQAAKAADMTAIGFIGGGHCDADRAELLLSAGANHIMNSYEDLRDYFFSADALI